MKYDVSVRRGRYVFQQPICKRICHEWTTRPVQHTKSHLGSVCTPIGVHLCSNMLNRRCVRTRSPADTAVSGLASFPLNTLRAATTPPRYEERENFLKSFSYEWLPSLSARVQGKKRGGDFENCINQVSIHYTPSDSLRSAKCSWVRSYVTLHCRTSTQPQDSYQLILFTC